jgi:AraC-like DNA-binding protein
VDRAVVGADRGPHADATIPARQISAAINRLAAKNVSQYVNEHRIAAACRLLAETDRPVATIIFEVGFQTKSNFNREFRG